MTTDWIPHDGGDCPKGVPPDAVVEFRWQEGDEFKTNVGYARNINWDSRFVREYRVLRPGTEPEREGVVWVNLHGSNPHDCTGHASKTEADDDATSDRIALIRVPFKWRPGQFDEEPT